MDNFLWQLTYSIGTSYISGLLVEFTKLIASHQKNKISKKEIPDLLNEAKSQFEEKIQNEKDVLLDSLKKNESVIKAINYIRDETISNMVDLHNSDVDKNIENHALPLSKEKSSGIKAYSESIEVPSHIKKMDKKFEYEFNLTNCELCPLFNTELSKINQEEIAQRIKAEQEEMARRIKAEQEEMARRIKAEQEERETNSLKICEIIPKSLGDLLAGKWYGYKSDLRLCVFKGVHSGDNYLEKAIISTQALHDTHYYIVDKSATVITEIRVPDCLIDDKFLKITSKDDGFLIVYGGILFTVAEDGLISNQI